MLQQIVLLHSQCVAVPPAVILVVSMRVLLPSMFMHFQLHHAFFCLLQIWDEYGLAQNFKPRETTVAATTVLGADVLQPATSAKAADSKSLTAKLIESIHHVKYVYVGIWGAAQPVLKRSGQTRCWSTCAVAEFKLVSLRCIAGQKMQVQSTAIR